MLIFGLFLLLMARRPRARADDRTYRRLYGSVDGLRVFRAPGRVNLIGEHTDYNFGFVLPVALDVATFAATAPAADGKLRLHSSSARNPRFDVAGLAELSPAHHWTDYPIGVAREVARLGFAIQPANILIHSTVPEGSGLSSSAALEVSSALAFLGGRELAPLELAKLCQRSEREFVGIPCGIMDQYISVSGANTPPSRSIAAAGSPTGRTAGRRHVRGRQHHGQARAGGLGL